MHKDKQTFLFCGVPGVGKTSILNAAAKKFSLPVYHFGSILYELIKTEYPEVERVDEIRRKLNYSDYADLQIKAATEVAKNVDVHKIVISHLSVATLTGFIPGFPDNISKIIRPTTIFIIEAPAKEIIKRRQEDKSRQRGNYLEDQIDFHQTHNRSLAAAYSFSFGYGVYPIHNEQGKIDEAIAQTTSIIEALIK